MLALPLLHRQKSMAAARGLPDWKVAGVGGEISNYKSQISNKSKITNYKPQTNPKSQITNPKRILNLKSQVPADLDPELFRSFEIGACNLFAISCLRLGISPLALTLVPSRGARGHEAQFGPHG